MNNFEWLSITENSVQNIDIFGFLVNNLVFRDPKKMLPDHDGNVGILF
mgnify:CR=1 FL=1